jgi:hypothetical protein
MEHAPIIPIRPNKITLHDLITADLIHYNDILYNTVRNCITRNQDSLYVRVQPDETLCVLPGQNIEAGTTFQNLGELVRGHFNLKLIRGETRSLKTSASPWNCVWREDGVRLKVLRDKYIAGDTKPIPLTVRLTPVEPACPPTFSTKDEEAARESVTTLMEVMRKYYPGREGMWKAQEAWWAGCAALSEAPTLTRSVGPHSIKPAAPSEASTSCEAATISEAADDTIYRGL